MERLTKKIDSCTAFPEELIGVTLVPDNPIMCKMLLRLAAYEDTGLTPEEVLSMSGEWCAMMAVLNSIGGGYGRLRKLAEADKDGRVAVLPCNVGDTVYMIFGKKVEERRVIEFDVVACKSSGPVVHAALAADQQVTMSVRWDLVVDKTVFLTRKEAEAALKGVKNGRG